MTRAQLVNVAWYVAYAFVGALVATGLQLAQVLAGDGDILWRPLAATFTTTLFGALATALGASRLTRLGSEQIAGQVNALKAEGVPRSQMVVLSQDDAAAALAAPRPLLPAEMVPQIVAALKAEMVRDPDGSRPYPPAGGG